LLSNCSFGEFEEFVRVHSLCHGDHMTCITEKRTKLKPRAVVASKPGSLVNNTAK
jgi:hypothetical protein